MTSTAGLPYAGAVTLVCGLGNPEPRYAPTRHNAGVWFIEQLVARAGVTLTTTAKLPATSAKCPDGIRVAVLATYMNESGRAVFQLADYFKIAPASVLVAHDEVDLEPGVARFKFGGGHGGHNGVRDTAAKLGTQDFWRLRIGVGHPQRSVVPAESSATAYTPEVSDWVLGAPPEPERKSIATALALVAANWDRVGAGDMDGAMRAVHTS